MGPGGCQEEPHNMLETHIAEAMQIFIIVESALLTRKDQFHDRAIKHTDH